MGTDLTVEQTFQENIKNRLQEDIGKLIPDEVLTKLVEKSIQDIFFCRKEERESSYSSRTVVMPSWFDDTVSSLLKTKASTMIQEILDKDEDKIREAVTTYFKENGHKILAEFVMASIGRAASNNSYNIAEYFKKMLSY